jgi:prophage regulatory protein
MNMTTIPENAVPPDGRSPKRFLRQPQVLERVGGSGRPIWRWEKKGEFPRRRHLGGRTVGWLEAEVDEWCANREPRP